MKTTIQSKQLNQTPAMRAQASRAFTLTDLLVVIATVAVLLVLQMTALAGNKGKSKAMQCLSNVRQINLGTALFAQENGCYPPLYRQPNASGWPAWTYNSTSFMVKNVNALFWQDALRLEGYVKDPTIFSCPLLTAAATNIYALGIGINFPEIGAVIGSGSTTRPPKPADVKTPSQTVVFGDSGSVTIASAGLNPDAWIPDTSFDTTHAIYNGGGPYFFRSPSDFVGYSSGDARMLPRHDLRVVTGWADGHGAIIKNSQIGWQYAKGNALALWDR